MTAKEYFDDHKACLGYREGIPKDEFIHFAELKEQYTTKRLVELKGQIVELKGQTISLLESLVMNEWNISGPGLTRIKEYVSQLKASK